MLVGRSAHVFLCLLVLLRQVLLPLLKTLKEVNLEFVVVDGRTFTTEHPHAMIRCADVAYLLCLKTLPPCIATSRMVVCL